MMTPVPRGWETAGLCNASHDPRFFPVTESGAASASPADEERAASWCRICVVQTTCLEAGLDHGRETIGIWGGLGSAKRRHLRQARSRQEDEGYPTHRYTPGCGCSFCTLAGAYLKGDVVDRNTDGARCGYRSSYARNCRCPACTFVAALNTRRLNTMAA